MSTFASAVAMQDTLVQGVTANGMPSNASTGNKVLELFFILGASRGRDITNQFTAAFMEDPMLTIKALFWARDVRGGAGERDTFRKLMVTAERLMPERVMAVLHLIPEYGRWDDGYCFQSAPLREAWFSYVDTILTQGERAKHLLNSLDNLTEQDCANLLADIGT